MLRRFVLLSLPLAAIAPVWLGALLLGFGLPLFAQVKPAGAANFAALAAKANAARDAEQLDQALPLYRKALALRRSWAEGWWSLGTIEYDQNAYAEAARAFRKVIALSPKNGTAFVMLGLSEFELGRDALSLEHIRKGADLGLNKDEGLRHAVLYHEGVLFQRKGEFVAAQETLDQLCLQGVRTDDIANALGMTMLRMAIKGAPASGSLDADVVVRIGRAECLAAQRKYDEARRDFEAVVRANPSYPNVHYAYGRFLLEASDVAGGVEQFKQEIANGPGHVFARLQIAAAQYKVDSAAGLPYAEEAVRLNSRLPFGHYLLGLLLLDTDEVARAIPELESAQKTFSRDPKLYFALGSAYSRAGRKQDAARARATFERLTKEGAASTADADEAGVRRALRDKTEPDRDAQPPQ